MKLGLTLVEVDLAIYIHKKTRTTCVVRAFVVKFLTFKLLKSVSKILYKGIWVKCLRMGEAHQPRALKPVPKPQRYGAAKAPTLHQIILICFVGMGGVIVLIIDEVRPENIAPSQFDLSPFA